VKLIVNIVPGPVTPSAAPVSAQSTVISFVPDTYLKNVVVPTDESSEPWITLANPVLTFALSQLNLTE
jgi:hypothetical protein